MKNTTRTFPHTHPPLVVAVSNIKAHRSPFVTGVTLWSADVKLFRYGEQNETLHGVVFAEIDGVTCVAGMETAAGITPWLPKAETSKQHAFIEAIHAETRKDLQSLGSLAMIFFGHNYIAEAKTVAAFLAAHGTETDIGVGFVDDAMEYQAISFDPNDNDWLRAAKETLPFDRLGDDTGGVERA